LASCDAIPENAIPIALFNRLDLNSEMAANRGIHCLLLKQRIEFLDRQNADLDKKMNAIASRYGADQGIDMSGLITKQ
jgi:hypothetical protein